MEIKLSIFNNELESVREHRELTIDIERDGKEYTIECGITFIDAENMATPEWDLEIYNKDELKGFNQDDFDAIEDAIIGMARDNESEAVVDTNNEPF